VEFVFVEPPSQTSPKGEGADAIISPLGEIRKGVKTFELN